MRFPFDEVYSAAMKLLPANMDTVNAKAMLIAIGLQESRFELRRQMMNGPARGFWQFEQGGGVRGVLNHHATKQHALAVLARLEYDHYPTTVWNALEHNDILALCFARLNLWWIPGALPGPGEHEKAWRYYIEGWRPGKPHRGTWDEFYDEAWQLV
jgi:hypothetical protein